jgi:hypothetical protein
MFTQRHRSSRLVLAAAVIATLAACDNPVAPAPLTLKSSVASVDSSSCTHGYLVVQGVVSCLPGPG